MRGGYRAVTLAAWNSAVFCTMMFTLPKPFGGIC
jgi:hypothetical protein